MTYESHGPEVLDYFPCRYGRSKLLFRGPRRRLSGDYVAFLGGIETYGKFVELPFPTLAEHETGVKAVNLGCANVGVDAYLTDKSLLEICANARVTVIQVMGAQNMSNRYYAVHPRRNDRFLRASSLLHKIYAEVDFTEFSFTRHLLSSLAAVSPEKFGMVETELREAWVARMSDLLDQIGGKVVLLWLADHAPGEGPIDTEPMFIDRDMIARLADRVAETVEIVATPEERAAGFDEMVFGALEQPAAEELLGPVVHRRLALALAPILKRHLA
ncbi:hypothetical protein AIOL_000730 [Candidatus Rhodobacter oscarellae]|uniref:DUF6473 domain-containing protein n=1 Tax=Candidatus Rhodobacter oscarellae TaxID=1675527 RepID=A0A0J9H4I5_9RHOB|nr:DUF6473 family protein [Candidatus Rhodobacter lobularis]KMW60568.1 hypothetical protein AIOL_000730 [Candidatus Rhodobacter lobularis]